MLDSTSIRKLPLAQLTVGEFYDSYVSQDRPVHLTETIGTWGACLWTRGHLGQKIGSKRVRLFYNERSTFDYNRSASTGVVRMGLVPLAEALALIHSDQGSRYYIQQQNMKTEFPELLSDIDPPPVLDERTAIEYTNIWIGGRGCKTPLHYDRPHNLLVQVSGTKRVILFPPDQACNLYPAVGDIFENCSRVNVFEPDFGSYPLFREATQRGSELLLEPGDTLYIPVRWWHAVELLQPSISVNFWWHLVT